jgi:biotin carboxylase
MSVLVLHRGALAGAPYDRWLSELDADVLLLAAQEQLDLSGDALPQKASYRHVEAVSGYDVSGYVEARALELARRHGVRRIVATQERDLERAAQLREILGIPGQRLESATAFRDKVEMKKLVREAGIAVAPHAEVECPSDVIDFAGRFGFPVVLKPRNGGGSIGLQIIPGPEELDATLAGDTLTPDDAQPNLIAEAFVPGPMCHVDGLVVDGRVAVAWASQYLYALASYRTDPGGRRDVTLDRDDPLGRRLIAFTERVIQALPGPGAFAFHAEVFHTTDDELVLCEIACRPGGASIRDIGRLLFGVDLAELAVRAQAGLPLPVKGIPGPAQMAGQLVMMKRPGRILRVPGRPPFPWVQRSRLFVTPGQIMQVAAFSGDFMASFVISAPSRQVTEERLGHLEAWLQEQLVVEKVA